jgi:hypothetical protein
LAELEISPRGHLFGSGLSRLGISFARRILQVPLSAIGSMKIYDECLKEEGGLKPDQLLNKLMADVNSFVGKAEQRDNLTIIVIKAT